MSLKAKAYIAAVIALGALALAHALTPWQVADPARLACYLALAMVSSRLKVSLPSVTGTLSVFFVFVLYGVLQMAPCETFAIGAAAVLVQSCFHNRRRPRLYQVLFNLGVVAIATQASLALYGLRRGHASDSALLLAGAAVALFVMNTLPVALVIALTEGKRAYAVWRASYFWSFPFYLAGAAVAAVLAGLDRLIGWQTGLLILPVVYVTYRTYSVYLERVEDAKKHAEEVAALHLRTIEALALAIEAKDNTTHSHLRRVQIYALELGSALGLSAQELEALRAASLLHDIGKLAVPEHIISKPGRLTPEEFEKLKVHPVVGAEILEHVRFPYPVTPIVRSHHEKWDGSGYPDGLAGKDIPIGARIIAAVDCLDALASDRQYRRALPLDQAMERVKAESGRSFDPAVVRLLAEHYDDWESMAQPGGQQHHLSTDVKVTRGAEPAAGFEAGSVREDLGMAFTDRISAARQEVQSLYELAQDLGSSLSLTETLSLFALRLARLVSYDALAVYVDRGGTLKSEYVTGEYFRILSSL